MVYGDYEGGKFDESPVYPKTSIRTKLINGDGTTLQNLEVPFSTTTVQAVATSDVSNYKGVAVQIVTQGTSSTVTFQGSNNGTTWVSVALTISTSVTTAPVVSTTSASSYYGPLHFKYFRLNVSGITANTTSGIVLFKPIYSSNNAITSTAVTVGASATSIAKAEDSVSANANVGVPPLAVRADTTQANAGVSANGDYAFMFCDNNGRLYTNSLMVGKTSNTTFQTPRIDLASNVLQTIDLAHQKIHEGEHFMYTDSVELADTGTQDYLITTPNTTKWAHMCFYLDGYAVTQWQLYEASDKTGTAAQTVGNNNRNSATTATTTIHKGTSGGTTDGSLAYSYKGGSATNQAKTGTESGNNEEIILKQNTKYILRVTSFTAANLTNMRLEWYELTNLT